jgi:GntR family transcriptional regulator
MIEFNLSGRSGVAPYMQLIQQVRHALRLGLLHEGDQLPKVKDVAAALAINPNTVLGTFVTGTLGGPSSLAAHEPLRRDLRRWLAKARGAGLDDESIEALFASTFRAVAEEDIA